MAKSSLKRRLTATTAGVAVAFSLVLFAPAPANAAMAVFDGTAIGKAIEQIKIAKEQVVNQLEQLKELQKHFEIFSEIKGLMNEVNKTMGEVGSISLPIPNVEKMGNQTRNNLGCLIPKTPAWGIKQDDWDFGSVCNLSKSYQSALFVSPKAEGTPHERKMMVMEAEARRMALLEDTVSRALAQADVQVKHSEDEAKAADDLQGALNRAETVQDRLHVVGQINLAQMRQQTATNQLLATIIKLQAVTTAQSSLGAYQVSGDNSEGQKK